MMADSDEAQRRVLHRLRRAQGQLAAVIKAVEDGKTCREVITQLTATSKALNRAGIVIISSAMQECLADEAGAGVAGNMTEPAEFVKLFMMLA